ncbi:MAG: hypothetical protein H6922_04420 [Pseudomonadaceae bacterium]|nr:hypothetical protein [Pseudomonadaceae bacterium]
MVRFMLGSAILLLTMVWGLYSHSSNSDLYQVRLAGLEEAETRRDEGKNLQQRIKVIRAISMAAGDDQKFNIERALKIGSPGLELRFIGQPRVYGGNRALIRHTFRISGPATYAESESLVRKLVTSAGYAPYKYCYGCGLPPKNTPPDKKMVQVEGYLYVYDPQTFY